MSQKKGFREERRNLSRTIVWTQYDKTLNTCNLQMFVISLSVRNCNSLLVRQEPTLQILYSRVGSWPYPQFY
jgi:hypothetical protein